MNTNYSEPFGGSHVIFIGDFTQLGPVRAGNTITQAVMDIHADMYIQKWMNSRRTQPKNKSSLIPPKNKDHGRYAPTHPYRLGVDIFTKVRWFELTQQQRSATDPVHTAFHHKTFLGGTVRMNDVKANYKLLFPQDFQSLEWIKAPVAVATNRERHSLTHMRSIQFAKITGTVVIRWLVEDRKNWLSCPDPIHISAALQDPCFYELFVEGADAFVTENILRELYIVNGLPVKYHSLTFEPDIQEWLEEHLVNAVPGDVITLPKPPISVNIVVPISDTLPAHIVAAMHEFSLEKTDSHNLQVVLPIYRGGTSWANSHTPVYGSEFFGPSKVILKPVFPLEPAFAITVHKSEGRTMDRLIIALSKCDANKCNFSYEQLHLAFSRVTAAKHIRLLLTGDTEMDQWQSLAYLMDLKQDPSLRFYFCGFRQRVDTTKRNKDPNSNWLCNEWCPERANREFRILIESDLV